MRFETMESFVGQLALHKYGCKGNLIEGDYGDPNYGYSCDLCQIKIQVNVQKSGLSDSVWSYIRGGDKRIFQQFFKDLDCHIYPGSTYENLFAVYSVMQC